MLGKGFGRGNIEIGIFICLESPSAQPTVTPHPLSRSRPSHHPPWPRLSRFTLTSASSGIVLPNLWCISLDLPPRPPISLTPPHLPSPTPHLPQRPAASCCRNGGALSPHAAASARGRRRRSSYWGGLGKGCGGGLGRGLGGVRGGSGRG